MKYTYYIIAFFLIVTSNARSMEKYRFNEFSEELALRIVYSVASSNDYFENCIATLRNCTRVNKQWHKIMSDYAYLIIDQLANKLCVRCNTQVSLYSIRTVIKLNEHESTETFQRVYGTAPCKEHDPAFIKEVLTDYNNHHEVAKVVAAICLSTHGSRNWLAQNYTDKKEYKTLFGKMVQYPYALDFIPELRKVNEACGCIANQEVDNLVGILQQEDVPEPVGRFLLNGLCVRENTLELVSQEIDSILTELLSGKSSDNFKRFLIEFVNRKNLEYVNAKAPGSAHHFWCDVISSNKDDITMELFKLPLRRFEKCGSCNMNPMGKVWSEGRGRLIRYLFDPLWD